VLSAEAFSDLISSIRNWADSSKFEKACERLHREAPLEDVPRLMTLLKDEDALVREAAAWPVSELVGTSALRDLLNAYQRGFDQGLDNDGFTTALIDLVELDPVRAAAELRDLAQENPSMRENALWLLEFCADSQPESTNPNV